MARRIGQLLAVQQQYRDVLREAGARGIVRDIAEHLIGSPFVTIRGLADVTGATYQAASNAAGRLVTLGILEESQSSPVRVLRAPAVLGAILDR
jgi:hypothetical protein